MPTPYHRGTETRSFRREYFLEAMFFSVFPLRLRVSAVGFEFFHRL